MSARYDCLRWGGRTWGFPLNIYPGVFLRGENEWLIPGFRILTLRYGLILVQCCGRGGPRHTSWCSVSCVNAPQVIMCVYLYIEIPIMCSAIDVRQSSGVPRGVFRVLEHPHQPDFLTNVFFQLECPWMLILRWTEITLKLFKQWLKYSTLLFKTLCGTKCAAVFSMQELHYLGCAILGGLCFMTVALLMAFILQNMGGAQDKTTWPLNVVTVSVSCSGWFVQLNN